jgi:hypothetical protein
VSKDPCMNDRDDRDEVERYRRLRDRMLELASLFAAEQKSAEDQLLGRRLEAWERILDPRQDESQR